MKNMTLPKLYYTLPDFAKEKNRSESDLLQMAAIGALRLSVKHFGTGHYQDNDGSDVQTVIDGYVQLDSDDCESILEFGCLKMSSLIRSVSWQGKRVYVIDNKDMDRDQVHINLRLLFGDIPELPMLVHARLDELKLLPTGVPTNRLKINNNSDLLILPDEAARVEPIFSEPTGQRVNQEDQRPKKEEEGEKVDGYLGIAAVFQVTERTAKNYAKKPSFPLHKTTSKRVYAFKSELLEWKKRFDEEKPKRKKDAERKSVTAVKKRQENRRS